MTNEIEKRAFYFVVTENQRWGRSASLKLAMKNAMLHSGTNSKTKFIIYIGFVKGNATDEILDNIISCFNVSMFGGIQAYAPMSEFDREQLYEYFLGWATNTDFWV